MKEQEALDEIKENNRFDLLEPLVDEKQPNASSNKKFPPLSLAKSVNIPNNNDYDSPSKNPFLHNSIDPNYSNQNSNDPINRIRKEIGKVKKESQTEISNYSNIPEVEKLKLHNFIYIIIVTIFSSLQYGIYLFIFNLATKSMNPNAVVQTMTKKELFYSFFLILTWKYQIYFIIYLVYALCIYFKLSKKKSEGNKDENGYQNFNEEESPFLIDRSNSFSSQESFLASYSNPTFKFREFKYKFIKNFGASYQSYFRIFLHTSNIFNVQEKDENVNYEHYFNLNEAIRGVYGVLFSYLIFAGSNFYYFGIIYLLQEITSLLPYYIQYEKILNNGNNINVTSARSFTRKIKEGHNNGEYYKYIFPLLISFGLYYLQKTLSNNYLYLFGILISCVIVQFFNQKKFILNSHEESPFQILFRTYLNYSIVSLSFCFLYEIFNGFNIKNVFYWLTNLKLFFSCLIGFGICGAIFYNTLIIFMRIPMSNNIIVKLIKYFNLIIIDIVGIFIFRQYFIVSYFDYIVGISLCAVSMFLLDFHKII